MKQLGDKILLLPFYVSITIGMLLYGLLASDNGFTDESPRSMLILLIASAIGFNRTL